jgi:hypothetical protein
MLLYRYFFLFYLNYHIFVIILTIINIKLNFQEVILYRIGTEVYCLESIALSIILYI